MYEINEAAKIITGAADDDARVIFGAVINEDMKDEVKITVVATGFEGKGRLRGPSPAGPVSEAAAAEKADRKQSVFFEKPTEAKSRPRLRLGQEREDEEEDEEAEELEIPAFIRKKMN